MLYICFYLNWIPAPEGTGIFKGAVQESSGETVADWLTHLKEWVSVYHQWFDSL